MKTVLSSRQLMCLNASLQLQPLCPCRCRLRNELNKGKLNCYSLRINFHNKKKKTLFTSEDLSFKITLLIILLVVFIIIRKGEDVMC